MHGPDRDEQLALASLCKGEIDATHGYTCGGLVALLGSGCVWGPFYDDTIASTTSSVTFTPLSTTSGATIRAYCANHYSPWTLFGTTTAATSPVNVQGDNLYPAELRRVIPAACWDWGWDEPLTFLKFTQSSAGRTYDMAVFDQAGVHCVGESLADGDGAVAAGLDCKREVAQIRLFAEH